MELNFQVSGRTIDGMDPSEIVLLFLKYAGSIVAGAYGIYATLTDFKEEENGRKVLSAKGRWGIALFLCSLLMNVFSDGIKDYREHVKEGKDKAGQILADKETQDTAATLATQLTRTETINTQLDAARHDLSKTANTTASVLNETRRVSDPFVGTTGFRLYFDLMVPGDQLLVKSYLERITHEHWLRGELPTYPLFVSLSSAGIPVYGLLSSTPGSPHFPDSHRPSEERLAAHINISEVVITFERGSGFPGWYMDSRQRLKAIAECRVSSLDYHMPRPSPHAKVGAIHLDFECEDVIWQNNDDSRIDSYQDFNHAVVGVEVADSTGPPQSSEPDMTLRPSVRLVSPKGRHIDLTNLAEKCVDRGQPEHFRCWFDGKSAAP